MLHFLPTHINCLENQVRAFATAEAMNRGDVEELMSIFGSLAGELEKSLAKEHLSESDRQSLTVDFKRLAAVGGRIRGMAIRLRKEGHTLGGIDPFVRSVIRCRDIAFSDEVATDPDHGGHDEDEMTSRPGEAASPG